MRVHKTTDPPYIDVMSRMYETPSGIVELAEKDPSGRPIVLVEYAHSMGNSTGNLSDYWNAIRSHERSIGGFIWDWRDQGLRAETPEGEPYVAYGVDLGDRGGESHFNLNGIVFSDGSPQPALWEVKKVYQPVQDTPWTTAGYTRACAQFVLPYDVPAPTPPTFSQLPDLAVTETSTSATIEDSDFQLTIDKSSGALTSFIHEDEALVRRPLTPNYWRAPPITTRPDGNPNSGSPTNCERGRRPAPNAPCTL